MKLNPSMIKKYLRFVSRSSEYSTGFGKRVNKAFKFKHQIKFSRISIIKRSVIPKT